MRRLTLRKKKKKRNPASKKKQSRDNQICWPDGWSRAVKGYVNSSVPLHFSRTGRSLSSGPLPYSPSYPKNGLGKLGMTDPNTNTQQWNYVLQYTLAHCESPSAPHVLARWR